MTRWMFGLACAVALVSVSVASAQEDAKKERRGPGGRGGFNREEVLKKFDKDNDGKLSDDEKAEARKSMEEQFAKRREEMTKKFDKDGDGKLSDDEREALRKEFGGRGPGGRGRGPGGPGGPGREEFLKRFDKDGDGKLSEEERAAARKEFEGRRGGRRPGADKPAEEKKEA